MQLHYLITCGAMALALAIGQAQKPLTNADIVEMVKAGFDEETIIKAIEANKPGYDTSVQGLLALKNAGVSSKVIKAILAASTPTVQPASETPPATQPTIANLPTEVGVYIKKDDQWIEIQPEIVNWRTGGWLKTVATAGIVKGDVNGWINAAHSRNAVKTPLGFLIVTPEGVAITEYQLIHLHEKPNIREFRTVTGGVLHASSGATRDLLQFEGARVASRRFSVNLPTLGAGEYGFLPPGGLAGSSASGVASAGKMYTFRVGE
jgi:hypothetical protein